MKIKSIFTFFLSIILYLGTNAQTVIWQKAFGYAEAFNSVMPTSDGGFILGGYISSTGAGGQDFMLVKINSAGDTLWGKCYGSPANDYGLRAQQTNDGGYIIVGKTNGYGAGSNDILLLKTGSSGNISWAKTYGNASYNDANTVQQTTDNGYIIGTTNGLLIKTDINGDTLWTRKYAPAGGSIFFYTIQTTDGGYAAVGSAQGAGNEDCFMIKTDSSGILLWSKTYGGTNLDEANVVKQTTGGGYMIGGFTNSFGAGSDDMFVIRTDSIGDTLWTRTFGGAAIDRCYHACVKANGEFLFTGYTNSFGNGYGMYAVSVDGNGNLNWDKEYGNGCGLGSSSMFVNKNSDGGFILAGGSYCFNAGAPAGYLVKCDSLGNSNCYETNPTTISGMPATIVLNPATVVSLNAYIVTAPVLIQNTAFQIESTLCATVKTEDTDSDLSFRITPNPSPGIFFIEFLENQPAKYTIKIYNTEGVLVYNNENINKEMQINLSEHSLGLYLIKTISENKCSTQRIIISR